MSAAFISTQDGWTQELGEIGVLLQLFFNQLGMVTPGLNTSVDSKLPIRAPTWIDALSVLLTVTELLLLTISSKIGIFVWPESVVVRSGT